MSIKTNITTILVSDELELEEVAERLEDKMKLFSLSHPDFSAIIEKHLETNQVVVKVIYLQEHVN